MIKRLQNEIQFSYKSTQQFPTTKLLLTFIAIVGKLIKYL